MSSRDGRCESASRRRSGCSRRPDGRRRLRHKRPNDETWEIDARGRCAWCGAIRRVTRPAPSAPTARTFALGSSDGTVRLVDRGSGRGSAADRSATRRSPQARVHPRRAQARELRRRRDDGDVIVWDVAKGEINEELRRTAVGSGGSRSPRTGARCTAAGNDGRPILWDLSGDRRLVRSFPVDPRFAVTDTPRGIAVSPDGQTLALTHSNGMVDLLDTQTLRRRDRVRALPGFAAAVGLQPGRAPARRGRRGRPRHALGRPDARSGGRAARAAGRLPGARLLARRKSACRSGQHRAPGAAGLERAPARARPSAARPWRPRSPSVPTAS